MDAAVAKIEPTTKSHPPHAPLSSARWVSLALAATISVGVVWRLVRYFAGFPIWGDEAMVLLNILERDYLGLTDCLRFNQVAPLAFLWLEKTALLTFGAAELSMHLFPFLAGLVALGLFWHVCRTSFSPRVAGLAVAILAVSYYPVRHGSEVKPYSFDLFFAVVFAWLTLGYLRDRGLRWLVAIMFVAPIAIFASYPSAFVGGTVSLVLLPRMWHATWKVRGVWIGFNLALGGAFVAHYLLVGQKGADPVEVERAHEFLRTYWKDAFPPETPLEWPLWLVKVFTGNMLAYPVGAHNGGSTLTLLFVLLGTFALRRNGALVALCWLPFALNLVAACLHKYPFGGSARITLHLAPFICILMAHGIAQALDGIRAPVWRTRAEFAFTALLLLCGVVGVTRDVRKPYKTIHDRDVRQLVHDIGTKIEPNEPILLCHERDEDVIAEFTWYLRTQALHVEFLAAHSLKGETQICLICCSNHELTDADVLSRLGAHAPEWRIERSEMRRVPPENDVLPPFYCRWVHLVRAGQ